MHCTALRGVAPPPALSIDVSMLLAELCGVATVATVTLLLLPLATVLPVCAMRCVVILLCVVVGRGRVVGHGGGHGCAACACVG